MVTPNQETRFGKTQRKCRGKWELEKQKQTHKNLTDLAWKTRLKMKPAIQRPSKPRIKHLMTGPEGNSWFCSPRFEGNKINCFLRNQSLSDLLYIWKFIKPRCNGGRQSTVYCVLLAFDVIDFAMLPAQSFWRETVSLLDIMWPQGNQESARCLEKVSSYITKSVIFGLYYSHLKKQSN